MIIRHDLQLVFIHVPKCAGKQLRWIFKTTSNKDAVEELWNYEHSATLDRYVDLAHLPLTDLRHYPQFQYLDQYTVVACIRDPYMRLPSAVNEYYRQKTKRFERKANKGKISSAMKERYYRKIQAKHSELDPRFIHSLPISRFTHYGREPKVDHLLRCETLKEDMELLAEELNWPDEMHQAIPRHLKTKVPEKATLQLTEKEQRLAEAIYEDDFETFGYPRTITKPNQMISKPAAAGKALHIHQCAAVEWHWGPKAQRKADEMKPTRTRC